MAALIGTSDCDRRTLWPDLQDKRGHLGTAGVAGPIPGAIGQRLFPAPVLQPARYNQEDGASAAGGRLSMDHTTQRP